MLFLDCSGIKNGQNNNLCELIVRIRKTNVRKIEKEKTPILDKLFCLQNFVWNDIGILTVWLLCVISQLRLFVCELSYSFAQERLLVCLKHICDLCGSCGTMYSE